MSNVPLCGGVLMIREFNMEIIFLDPQEVIVECLDAVPGCALLDEGYITIREESNWGRVCDK
jgi:hypothetical protein